MKNELIEKKIFEETNRKLEEEIKARLEIEKERAKLEFERKKMRLNKKQKFKPTNVNNFVNTAKKVFNLNQNQVKELMNVINKKKEEMVVEPERERIVIEPIVKHEKGPIVEHKKEDVKAEEEEPELEFFNSPLIPH